MRCNIKRVPRYLLRVSERSCIMAHPMLTLLCICLFCMATAMLQTSDPPADDLVPPLYVDSTLLDIKISKLRQTLLDNQIDVTHTHTHTQNDTYTGNTGYIPLVCVHRDQEQEDPLFGTLSLGIEWFEIDVWLVLDTLHVTHNPINTFTGAQSITNQYLHPLSRIIELISSSSSSSNSSSSSSSSSSTVNGKEITINGREITILVDLKSDSTSTGAFDKLNLLAKQYKHIISHWQYGVYNRRAVRLLATGFRWTEHVCDLRYKAMHTQTGFLGVGLDGRSDDNFIVMLNEALHTHSHPNTDTHTHPNTDTHTHPNTDTHTHPNTDIHTHPNTDTHTHPNTDTHTHPNTDTHTDPNTQPPTHRRSLKSTSHEDFNPL
eukprot:GHVR01147277.1.p1 GENE.GHVR01147277.1~~GHVR01147277.1.p1  ORF type:complete len:376 (+),score=159.29 GHVR01147277.1:217-1344(+)